MNSKTTRHILIIAAVAIASRLLYHFTYEPWWTLDSPDYAWRWQVLKNLQWNVYDGYKPPVYSVFLGLAQALAGSEPASVITAGAARAAVWLHQLAGVLAAAMVYLTLRNLTNNTRTALIGGVFFALLGAVCLFEMIVLPLATTAYLLLGGIWLFTVAMRRSLDGGDGRLAAAASGLAFGIGALNRAEITVFLLALVGLTFVASLLYRKVPEFRALRPVAFMTGMVGLPMIGAWVCFNGLLLGQFTVTTAAGYNRTCTVYNLFDRVEPQDEVFGRIMMKYYRGEQRIDLVNDAWPELGQHAAEMPIEQKSASSNSANMMAYAGEVAGRLQRRFPLTYLANALRSFGRTFDFKQGLGPMQKEASRGVETPDGRPVLKSESGDGVARVLRLIQSPLMLALYCLSLAAIFITAAMVLVYRRVPPVRWFVVTALCGSLVLTLLAFGFAHTYFSHYGLVYFGCIVICGTAVAEAIFQWFRARRAAAA